MNSMWIWVALFAALLVAGIIWINVKAWRLPPVPLDDRDSYW